MNPTPTVSTRSGRWLAGLLVAAAAVGGCGGGGGSDVSATPPGAPSSIDPYTVRGAISVTETSAIDSDTNDPNQPDRSDNGTFESLQQLPNPVQLVGYLTMPGGIPDGPASRTGDVADGYRMRLEAGQVVELEFSADPQRFDIDLYIYDGARRIVGQSIGVNQYECVRISATGEYAIGVEVYAPSSRNGSVYQLRVGAPGSGTACANATGAADRVLADRIIAFPDDGAGLGAIPGGPGGSAAKAAAPAAARAARQAADLNVLKGDPASDRPVLVELPVGAGARGAAITRLTAAARSVKQLGALDAAAGAAPVAERVAALTSAWRRGLSPEVLAVRRTFDDAKLLVASGAYRAALPEYRVRASQTRTLSPFPPNDREYVKQRWHYEAINLPGAVAALQGLDLSASPAPIVAVLDTGIVADHPDLVNQVVPGYDFVSDPARGGDGGGIDPDPDDAARAAGTPFHGTHVAGIVAAEGYNGIGGTGVAPIARIMPVRVLGVEGGGGLFDILQGIRFAAGLATDAGVTPTRPADVINLSLGAEGLACEPSLQALFNEVRARGIVVVAAAGNESTATRTAPVGFPANCETVFSVAATDARGQRAPYSNVGPQNFVAAPGGDSSRSTTGNGLPDGIYSTVAAISGGTRTPTYGFLQGTSMATPHVAGVVALMRWVNPALNAAAIESLIRSGAIVDDIGAAGRDQLFGYGLINARKAVDAALASRGGAPVPVGGRTEAQPSTLSLGAIRTEADFVLSHVGASNERVVSVTTDSPAITVGPMQSGAVDAATGLGTYRVHANRNAIPAGTSAFPNVIVRLAPERTITIPVALSRVDGSAGLGTMGAVYVLILDAATPDRRVVGSATLTAPINGVYRYDVAVPGTPAISILAGNDVDNDGFICSAGEACGAYPTLASDLVVLRPTGSLTDIDFSLWPFGGIRPAAAVKAR